MIESENDNRIQNTNQQLRKSDLGLKGINDSYKSLNYVIKSFIHEKASDYASKNKATLHFRSKGYLIDRI